MAVELVGIETCYRREEEIPARFKSCPCGWLPPRRAVQITAPFCEPAIAARRSTAASMPISTSPTFASSSRLSLVRRKIYHPESTSTKSVRDFFCHATFRLSRTREIGTLNRLRLARRGSTQISRKRARYSTKFTGGLGHVLYGFYALCKNSSRKWLEIIAESIGSGECCTPVTILRRAAARG